MTPERKQRWRTLGIVAGTAVIALIMIWVNTYQRMAREYARGEEFYAQGDYLKAITAYESAIHAYVPWSARIRDAAEKLWQIGNRYEEQGEIELALLAYRSLRSSFYAVRSFYQPYPEWITRTDERIGPLMERQQIEEGRLARQRAEGILDLPPEARPAEEAPPAAEAAPAAEGAPPAAP